LYLLVLKIDINILFKVNEKRIPVIVPIKGNVFKNHEIYSKSGVKCCDLMKIEEPKKGDPIPAKKSLNHKPEKRLPTVKRVSAKRILFPIGRTCCT